jgi:hypothetical protein
LSVFGLFFLKLFQDRLATRTVDFETWILISVSALLNIGVIAYHYSIPAHPKFLIIPKRKWTLRFHVWSGTIELIAGFFACYFFSPTAALIQGLAALCIHVPTALIQTPIVFGSKAIMLPSYLLCILIHGYCAFELIHDPSSQVWAVNTFLIFNVYAWCRFYFYLFDRFQLMGDQKYTVSILLAGLTIIPALFGALSVLLLVTFIFVHFLLVQWFLIKEKSQYDSFVEERGRDTLFNSNFLEKNLNLSEVIKLKNESPRDKAEFVFNLLDTDKNRLLGELELSELLYAWGISKNEVSHYFRYLNTSKINFDIFFHKMSPIWKYVYFDILRAFKNAEKTEMIGRSIEALKSNREVSLIKNEIHFKLLKSVHFLKDANDDLIEDLAASLTTRSATQDEIIFHEGDAGDRFYVIRSGKVSVLKHNQYLTSLGEGAWFGEIALIEDVPRNATIKADSNCTFYALSKASFDYVVSTYPDVEEQIRKLIIHRK